MARLRPSEKILEERRIAAQELFDGSAENGPGAETERSKVSLFWETCPFGHPDDRVGESKSSVLDDLSLGRLADFLCIDGEVMIEMMM